MSGLELAWSEHAGHACLRVLGWTATELREPVRLGPAGLGRRLAVFPSGLVAAATDLRGLQPLAGRFEIDDDAICFIPRFPFVDGLNYALVVQPALGENEAVWTIQRPARQDAPTTEVVAIYPSAADVPVNLLKLYVQFSSPMSEGWAARAVHVRRADNGELLKGVFLPVGPELWDRERRRLTLLLDPGRIKRGLLPHQRAGYPLAEGVPFVLTIDSRFRDADGRPLRTSAERRYEVGPPLRARVNPGDWQYRSPAAGSMDPLTVEFDRPLDHALLQHALWVHDAAGVPLAGRGSVGSGERGWRFEPQSPWKEGRYVVIVDPRLEDLAGNSVIRVFDRDLTRAQDAPADAGPVAIDVTCSPPSTPTRATLTS